MTEYRKVVQYGRVRYVRVPGRSPEGTCPGGGAGVCACDRPSPATGLGECAGCGRPIVTFMSNPEANRRTWPRLYERAVRLGVTPEAYEKAKAATR